MLNKSQEEQIIDQIRATGEVTRNWCLQRYISRLSAIIYNLKKKGWGFMEENRKGDYVYIVACDPRAVMDDTGVYSEDYLERRREQAIAANQKTLL